MNLQEYKKKALKNKKFREEYEKYDPVFEAEQATIEAKMKLHI